MLVILLNVYILKNLKRVLSTFKSPLFFMVCTYMMFALPILAEEQSPQKMPAVEVIEGEETVAATETPSTDSSAKPQNDIPQEKQAHICDSILVNRDIEERFKKIQDGLEADYAQGMPKQLKTDLLRVRTDIDGLSVKLFEIDTANSQEVNHIAVLTVDYLEKMISLLPKAHQMAPAVRDRFVVPFTNMSSIRAEYQDCLTKNPLPSTDEAKREISESASPGNTFRKLTHELERLNQNLYTLQTADVQSYISFRAKILKDLEEYNKTNSTEIANQMVAGIPKILNTVHEQIEKLIPGLELSKEYLTLAH